MRIISETKAGIDKLVVPTFVDNAEQRIDFPFGIPGFETSRFYMLSRLKEHEYFNMLKAEDDSQIALLVMNAGYLKSKNCIMITPAILESVSASDQNALSIYVVLKIDQESGMFTANLRAPLIVNDSTNVGRQVILDNKSLPVAHPLIPLSNQE